MPYHNKLETDQVDPRVQRTKKQLRQALVELLADNTLKEISIQKVTKVANVTRGTFYLHYDDKQDFIKAVVADLIQDCYQQITHVQTAAGNVQYVVLGLQELFEYVEQQQAAFKNLAINENTLHFKQQLQQQMRLELQRYVNANYPEDSQVEQIPLNLTYDYLAGASLTLVFKWLTDGLVYSPRYMARILHDLLQSQVTQINVANFYVVSLKDLD